jgi:hypothetical protein
MNFSGKIYAMKSPVSYTMSRFNAIIIFDLSNLWYWFYKPVRAKIKHAQ